MEPGFKTQLVTSLRSPGREHARDIAGSLGGKRLHEVLGEEAREGDAMTAGAGRGPCAVCYSGSTPVGDGEKV